MNPSMIACLCTLSVLFLVLEEEQRKRRIVRRMQNRKKRGRFSTMRQLIERFLGKEVVISSIIGSVRGVLCELSDNAVAVETKGGTQVVNIDYIYSVKEAKVKK